MNDPKALDLARRELYMWRMTGGTWFTAGLYDLFQKADPGNFRRLSSAFPDEAAAFREWMASENEQKLFKEWELDWTS